MPPVFSESLITNIAPQGNHFFTYKATLNLTQGGAGGRGHSGAGRGGPGGMGGGMGGRPGGGMGGGPGGGGNGMQSRMRNNPEEAAMDRLNEVLGETGYCPGGWFIIEKTFDRGSAEIRGECRTASADKAS